MATAADDDVDDDDLTSPSAAAYADVDAPFNLQFVQRLSSS